MSFILDPRLEQDSTFVYNLTLSEVRLSNNAAFPWLILIPKRKQMVELIDLTIEDQEQLLLEIRQTSQIMQALFRPKKLNIAALGNIVPQLHLHVIARYEQDLAWPNPVWNSGITQHYTEHEKQERIQTLIEAFKETPDAS